MAGLEVNPNEQPIQVPEFSREVRTPSLYLLEKGSRAGEAMGEAVKGAVEGFDKLATGAVKAGYTYLDEGSRKALQTGVDAINSQHGVQDAAKIAATGASPTGIQSSDQEPKEDMFDVTKGGPKGAPAGVLKLGATMKQYQDAYDAGKMSDSYYYAQMQSLVSQVKAQYPGFEKNVDEHIKNILGVNPANALRRSLLSDLDAAQRQKQSAQNFQVQYYKSKGPQIMNAFPGEDIGSIVKNHSFEEIFSKTSQIEAVNYAFRSDLTRLRDNEANSKAGVTAAVRVASDGLGSLGTQITGALTKKLGMNPDQLLEKAREESGSGQGLDTKTLAGLQTAQQLHSQMTEQAFKQFMTAVRPELIDQQHPQGRSISQLLPPDEVEKLHEKFVKDQMSFWDPVNNKDFGAIHATQAQNEASTNATIRRLQLDSRNESVNVVAGLRKLYGDNLLQEMASRGAAITINGKSVPLLQAAADIHLGAAGQANPGPTATWNESFDEVHGALKHVPPKEYTVGMLKRDMFALQEKTVPDQTKINLIKHNFGGDNDTKPFMSRFTVDLQQQLYSLVASPATTEEVWRLGQQDRDVWNVYAKWVTRNFGALYAEDEKTILSANRDPDSPYSISFNPGAGKFEINQRDNYGKPGSIRHYQFTANTAEVKAVKRLNSALESVKAVMEKEGVQLKDQIPQLSPKGEKDIGTEMSGKTPERQRENILNAFGGLFKTWFLSFNDRFEAMQWRQESGQKESPRGEPGGSEKPAAGE